MWKHSAPYVTLALDLFSGSILGVLGIVVIFSMLESKGFNSVLPGTYYLMSEHHKTREGKARAPFKHRGIVKPFSFLAGICLNNI